MKPKLSSVGQTTMYPRKAHRESTPARPVTSASTTPYGDPQDYRFIVAVYTPKLLGGTHGGHGNLGMKSNLGNYQVGNVGFCAMDTLGTQCIVSQYVDNRTLKRTLHKLAMYPACEVIIPTSGPNAMKSDLNLILEESMNHSKLMPFPHRHFSETQGLSFLKQLCLPELVQGLELTILSQPFALCALAGVLKFMELNHNVWFSDRSLRFTYDSINGAMIIDPYTARHLELLSNQAGRKEHTLFGVLNHTKTVLGQRLLRSSIIQPLSDVVSIEARLDVVQELCNNSNLLHALREALKLVPDVDWMITELVRVNRNQTVKSSEQHLQLLTCMRQLITVIPNLRACLSGQRGEDHSDLANENGGSESTASSIMKMTRDVLTDPFLDGINTSIEKVLEPDLSIQNTPIGKRNQRAFVVKPGIHGLLDVARQTYKESTSDIHQLVNDYMSTVFKSKLIIPI
jgi:DNA mismatch repair protein MSH4